MAINRPKAGALVHVDGETGRFFEFFLNTFNQLGKAVPVRSQNRITAGMGGTRLLRARRWPCLVCAPACRRASTPCGRRFVEIVLFHPKVQLGPGEPETARGLRFYTAIKTSPSLMVRSPSLTVTK